VPELGLQQRLDQACDSPHPTARLSVFTFFAPLFGVAAGHFILGDPLIPPFALAVVLVALGILLVNRPR
jgi:drug/metabolite transporter (DMT)-like permease